MPAASTPLITFGIPAFSRPKLLAEALDGIEGQDTSADYEVVVCDDGTNPESRLAVERMRSGRGIYFANERTLGGIANWNRCIAKARGKWVTILHEDDTLYPWYLSLVLPHLRDGLAAVCTRTVQGPSPPARKTPRGQARILPYPPRYFLKGSMSPFPGVLMRRDLALQLGGFDEKWGPLADYEFWYRLACAGRVEIVRAVGAFYRVAPGQWTEREWVRMLRLSHLLRRRIAAEQFPAAPRLGRWFARFFTYRNARSYSERFAERPPSLARALSLGRAPFSGLPSGWVWAALRCFARSS